MGEYHELFNDVPWCTGTAAVTFNQPGRVLTGEGWADVPAGAYVVPILPFENTSIWCGRRVVPEKGASKNECKNAIGGLLSAGLTNGAKGIVFVREQIWETELGCWTRFGAVVGDVTIDEAEPAPRHPRAD